MTNEALIWGVKIAVALIFTFLTFVSGASYQEDRSTIKAGFGFICGGLAIAVTHI